jgi:biotin transport system substrate-specific component
MKTSQLIAISSFFTSLTFLGAQLALYVGPVPITFQTFFVILSGLIGGARIGLVSQLLYLILGLFGLPVFAGFRGGLTVFMGPTAGYLFSFPIASAAAGLIFHPSKNKIVLQGLLACIISEIVVYGVGVPWLIYWLSNFGGIYIFDAFSRAILMGALIFLPGDALKIILILYLLNRKDIQHLIIRIRAS